MYCIAVVLVGIGLILIGFGDGAAAADDDDDGVVIFLDEYDIAVLENLNSLKGKKLKLFFLSDRT